MAGKKMKRKPGRPRTTGRGTAVMVRMHEEDSRLSMHGHGKAANRCLGQKLFANLSLSAYMQVDGANETNGQRCFSSRHLRL